MKYVLDVHCHTVASGHAYSTVTENAKYASEIGLQLLAITDHTPKMPGSTSYLYFLNLKVIPDILYGVRILKGAEVNILDISGKVDLKKGILDKLDLVIASFHLPCISPMSCSENTEAVINTMENKNINIIGHLGDPRYPIDIEKVVSTAKRTNTLIEINNSSLEPQNSRSGGEVTILEIIKECKRQNYPIVLGSDAHYFNYIGNFKNIEKLLKEADMPDELIANTSVEFFISLL